MRRTRTRYQAPWIGRISSGTQGAGTPRFVAPVMRTLSVVFLFLQYIIPVILMTVFYCMVAWTIWSRRDICEMMDGTTHRLTKELQMLRSKRKVKPFDLLPSILT